MSTESYSPIIVCGVHLKHNLCIISSITSIYGVGKRNAPVILSACGIHPNKRTKDLSSSDIEKIKSFIEGKKILIENDLRRAESEFRKLKKDIGIQKRKVSTVKKK